MNNIIDLNEYKNKKQSKNTMIVENTNSIREEWINEILDKCEDMIYKVKTRGEADLITHLIEFISNIITTNK